MVNSVNGKKESMDEVFPLIRKYGGVVIGLTIDEDGIPQTAEGRVKVAGKIIEEPESGIDKKDIVIDVLAMTISSERKSESDPGCLKRASGRLTASAQFWAVSNISFGLPYRPAITVIPTLYHGHAERAERGDHQSLLRI